MSSNFPTDFDTDDNLYLAKDSLRVRLAEDYAPGDEGIEVEGETVNFPPTGVITLTEQCSDVAERAISFRYTSRTTTTFDGLVLLPGFPDLAKPKRVTNVTQNVMADMHNALKDALISLETFAGVQNQTASVPLAGTMEQRINFLRTLVLRPRAWFSPSSTVGKVPLTVTLSDLTVRQADKWEWDFGDGSSTTVSSGTSGTTSHVYSTPGIYDLQLKVTNSLGSDTLLVPNLISARTAAPDLATLDWFPTSAQSFSGGILHTRNNQLVSVEVLDDGEQALDAITSYRWDFGDDLNHLNASQAKATYRIGGLYDVKLRVDTTLSAYRITSFPSVINVTEQFSLWMFLFDPLADDDAITKTASGYEFGLISETFKAGTRNPLSVTRDQTFLSGVPNEDQQVREFRRNNGFSPRSLVASGDRGAALLYWAEGAATPSDTQQIRFREYNGFDDVWTTPSLGGAGSSIERDWNWLSFDTPSTLYFHLGFVDAAGSPTNQSLASVSLNTLATPAPVTFAAANYLNGAAELMNNVGDGLEGDFSVYRTAWKDSSGYVVRNDGAGTYFRIKSFYRTEGILSDPIQSIRKLSDMPGSAKLEGELVPLTNGVYFFNNSGEVVVYNPTTNVWSSGGPGLNSNAFAALQDSTTPGFDDTTQTLTAASDGERTAFLSYDYSTKAFVRFNESDLTFTLLPPRPPGEQFMMGVF